MKMKTQINKEITVYVRLAKNTKQKAKKRFEINCTLEEKEKRY